MYAWFTWMLSFLKYEKLNDTISTFVQAEEFASRIQKLVSEGPAANRESTGPKSWLTR